MEPVESPDIGCNICCDTLRNEKFSPHMKLHEKRLNLDTSVACPSCREQINKRQLNPHFMQVKICIYVYLPIRSILISYQDFANTDEYFYRYEIYKQVHPADGGCCIECLRVMPRTQIRSHLSKV